MESDQDIEVLPHPRSSFSSDTLGKENGRLGIPDQHHRQRLWQLNELANLREAGETLPDLDVGKLRFRGKMGTGGLLW